MTPLSNDVLLRFRNQSAELAMAWKQVLPPGFRFHPTDEELVVFYLRRRALGLNIHVNVIAEVDIYRHDPWDLPAFSHCLSWSRDAEWYFFHSSDKKYPRGSRTNRATASGYWKATGRDRKVLSKTKAVVGMKKTLVFYKGRAPSGDRTDWVMHEYQLARSKEPEAKESESNLEASERSSAMVVCRVMMKKTRRDPTRLHL